MADIGDAIGINFVGLTGPETPFGRVKESGHGSEGGSAGLTACLLDSRRARRLGRWLPRRMGSGISRR